MSEYLQEAVVGQTRRPEPVARTQQRHQNDPSQQSYPGEQWTGRQPSPPGVNVK